MDLTLLQEFQPMAAQLSMEAVLPLANIIVTVSCRSSKAGPWATMNQTYIALQRERDRVVSLCYYSETCL